MSGHDRQFVLANDLSAPRVNVEIPYNDGLAWVNIPKDRDQCKNGIRSEFATLQKYEHITAEALLMATTRIRMFLLAYKKQFGSLSAEQEPLVRF